MPGGVVHHDEAVRGPDLARRLRKTCQQGQAEPLADLCRGPDPRIERLQEKGESNAQDEADHARHHAGSNRARLDLCRLVCRLDDVCV